MIAWRTLRTPVRLYRSLICSPRLSYRRFFASENDVPVKFSESPASGWKASYSRQGVNKEDIAAWFQPYVILGSISAFLLYFCVLREESDIDDMLSLTLYDRIDGLEKVQLEASLRYNLEHNLSTAAIEKRLHEIEEEEIRLFNKKK